jgi:hypothetical protein
VRRNSYFSRTLSLDSTRLLVQHLLDDSLVVNSKRRKIHAVFENRSIISSRILIFNLDMSGANATQP